MKRKHSIPAMALAATFAVSPIGFAADYGSSPNANNSTTNAPAATNSPGVTNAPADTTSGQSAALSGTVQNIDTSNQNVQIKDSNGTLQTVKVNTSTEITRDGQVIQLAEVHKGDMISVKNAAPEM